jgi:hypothetical protein
MRGRKSLISPVGDGAFSISGWRLVGCDGPFVAPPVRQDLSAFSASLALAFSGIGAQSSPVGGFLPSIKSAGPQSGTLSL